MFLHTVMIILFFILATYDCGYINTSILKFAHNLENTLLLFACSLQSGLEVLQRQKSLSVSGGT